MISAILAAASAQAANPGCQPVFDATAKVYSVPVHIYNSETAGYTGGKTRSGEAIYLHNATYVQINGKWRVSPVKQQELEEIRKKSQAEDRSTTCRVLRDEAVNGEAAVVYTLHRQTPDDKVDSQIWISKTRGLPIKLESDTDVGGMAGKSHTSTRYEYTNVQAPAGVH